MIKTNEDKPMWRRKQIKENKDFMQSALIELGYADDNTLRWDEESFQKVVNVIHKSLDLLRDKYNNKEQKAREEVLNVPGWYCPNCEGVYSFSHKKPKVCLNCGNEDEPLYEKDAIWGQDKNFNDKRIVLGDLLVESAGKGSCKSEKLKGNESETSNSTDRLEPKDSLGKSPAPRHTLNDLSKEELTELFTLVKHELDKKRS
jgi:hypothetical protein